MAKYGQISIAWCFLSLSVSRKCRVQAMQRTWKPLRAAWVCCPRSRPAVGSGDPGIRDRWVTYTLKISKQRKQVKNQWKTSVVTSVANRETLKVSDGKHNMKQHEATWSNWASALFWVSRSCLQYGNVDLHDSCLWGVALSRGARWPCGRATEMGLLGARFSKKINAK